MKRRYVHGSATGAAERRPGISGTDGVSLTTLTANFVTHVLSASHSVSNGYLRLGVVVEKCRVIGNSANGGSKRVRVRQLRAAGFANRDRNDDRLLIGRTLALCPQEYAEQKADQQAPDQFRLTRPRLILCLLAQHLHPASAVGFGAADGARSRAGQSTVQKRGPDSNQRRNGPFATGRAERVQRRHVHRSPARAVERRPGIGGTDRVGLPALATNFVLHAALPHGHGIGVVEVVRTVLGVHPGGRFGQTQRGVDRRGEVFWRLRIGRGVATGLVR